MKRIVLTFGLITGLVLLAMLAITMPLCMNGTIDMDQARVFGYASMVAAFLLVFFGIRSWRESVGGGVISFGKAFQVGILIVLVAAAVYVIAWEIYYFGFDEGFIEQYSASSLEKMREKGASDAEIAVAEAQMEKFNQLYRNPLFNAGVTFLEVFPVGLIVTLVSAAILRKRRPDGPAAAAQADMA